MASSLFDALANGAPEKKPGLADNLSGEFAKKVDRYAVMIVDGYMKNSIDVNKSIARIAQKENLNDDQISRIIEEVNNQIYLLKYNQMKNSPQREVVFDIAALPKIKELVKSGEANKPINQQKEASSMVAGFEKTASWEGETGDRLNFLNYSAYDTAGLAPEKQADRKAYLEKLALEKIASIEQELNAEIQKVAGETYTIAESLIKYDRAYIDAQDVFTSICKQANLSAYHQTMIKEGVIQKVAQLKEYKKLPEDYELKIDFVDVAKITDDFSLGKYSFMEKMASNTQSNQVVPIVVTDQMTVRNVNDLINLASDMVNRKEVIDRKQQEFDNTKNKLSAK